MPLQTSLPKRTKTLTPNFDDSSRLGLRQGLSRLFLAEDPGTETYKTEYRYDVEIESESGTKIYLVHPARLNNGFDFTIHVENQRFAHTDARNRTRRDDVPSHDNIADDLRAKQKENPSLFKQMKSLLEKTFQCVPIGNDEYKAFVFNSGLSVELLFKAIKWLFVEQDITYWNGKGRRMLYYEKLLPLWEPVPTLFEQD